jgi:hypothetical protein
VSLGRLGLSSSYLETLECFRTKAVRHTTKINTEMDTEDKIKKVGIDFEKLALELDGYALDYKESSQERSRAYDFSAKKIRELLKWHGLIKQKQ